MDDKWKPLFHFSVALLVAVILAWLGAHLLFSSPTFINSGWWLLTGILIVFGGIFMVGANIADWRVIIGFILTGFYICFRAAGIIDSALFARFAGLVCLSLAGMAVYVTWPSRHRNMHSKDAHNM